MRGVYGLLQSQLPNRRRFQDQVGNLDVQEREKREGDHDHAGRIYRTVIYVRMVGGGGGRKGFLRHDSPPLRGPVKGNT